MNNSFLSSSDKTEILKNECLNFSAFLENLDDIMQVSTKY